MAIPNKLRCDGIRFVLLEKGGKKPFEQGWQKKNIYWDDPNLKQHLNSKGNYGVMGGGEKKMVIVDFDDEKVQEEIISKLPETFTVKAGGGLLHKYFYSDGCDSFKIFNEEMDTLVDIQGEGKQVVGPGSIHPNGKSYEIVDNRDIAFINYSELKALLIPYDKKPKKEEKEKKEYIKSDETSDDFIDDLKRKIDMQDVLKEFGIDTSRNPTECLFHSSKGGKCLGFNNDTAHCFHCDGSWNIFSLVKDYKNYDFPQTLEFLADLGGMSDELEASKKDWMRQQTPIQKNELEVDRTKINWVNNNEIKTWDDIKKHSKRLWGHGLKYPGKPPEWSFIGHSFDEVRGRPQLIEIVQKRIPLVRCAVKKQSNKETEGKEIEIQKFYFFDEKFDKRHDGFQMDAFALDFRMYRVISEDSKEYYILSQEELPNQVCTFKGMLVELDDFAEMSRSMKISSLSRIFFMKEYESSIKVLTPEQIVKYTKNRGITEEDWLDFLALHEIGTSNRFPLEAELLRSSHILSSRVDRIPQHIAIMGPPGTRKSFGYIETIAQKFSADPHIVEGANSRIKGLTPSFAVKPANLGYLAKCERMGWIDELGKMIELESNKHQANTKNILGELNALLDNKVREVSSGNDNTCSIQATAKFIFVSNPVNGLSTLGDHVGLIDPTTMSRILWWVQDEDEQKFALSKGIVRKFPPTPSQAQDKGILKLERDIKDKKDIVLGKGWGKIDNREEFLTLFDSCNDFLCAIDNDRVVELAQTITQLAREPMKGVWKPRSEHHVKLLIDGLTKHRCLFRDYDPTFIAKEEDYNLAEIILLRMVRGWETNLSIKKDWNGGY